MKNSAKYLSLILAAGTAGVALFSLANASFTATVRGDVVAAVMAATAIVGLAAYDYSRRTQPLSVPARMVRPAMPAGSGQRSKAYGLNPARKDRIAA
jgi:hypothetical protein